MVLSGCTVVVVVIVVVVVVGSITSVETTVGDEIVDVVSVVANIVVERCLDLLTVVVDNGGGCVVVVIVVIVVVVVVVVVGEENMDGVNGGVDIDVFDIGTNVEVEGVLVIDDDQKDTEGDRNAVELPAIVVSSMSDVVDGMTEVSAVDDVGATKLVITVVTM